MTTIINNFTFNNGDAVTITLTGEQGTVRGRADYASGAVMYEVAYKNNNGELAQRWLEAELIAITVPAPVVVDGTNDGSSDQTGTTDTSGTASS